MQGELSTIVCSQKWTLVNNVSGGYSASSIRGQNRERGSAPLDGEEFSIPLWLQSALWLQVILPFSHHEESLKKRQDSSFFAHFLCRRMAPVGQASQKGYLIFFSFGGENSRNRMASGVRLRLRKMATKSKETGKKKFRYCAQVLVP